MMIKKKNDYKKGKLRCWGARLEGWREEWSKAWTKILRLEFPQKMALETFLLASQGEHLKLISPLIAVAFYDQTSSKV